MSNEIGLTSESEFSTLSLGRYSQRSEAHRSWQAVRNPTAGSLGACCAIEKAMEPQVLSAAPLWGWFLLSVQQRHQRCSNHQKGGLASSPRFKSRGPAGGIAHE